MDAMDVMDAMRTLLADGRKVEAIRLLPELQAYLTGEAIMMVSAWPVCAACHGFAELPHPLEANGPKVACPSAPGRCPGNQHGRMSPEQFAAYMTEKLTEAPVTDLGVETLIDHTNPPLIDYTNPS